MGRKRTSKRKLGAAAEVPAPDVVSDARRMAGCDADGVSCSKLTRPDSTSKLSTNTEVGHGFAASENISNVKVKERTATAIDHSIGSTDANKCATGIADSRLRYAFFDKECTTLAKALLGKMLIRFYPETGAKLKAMIVETEAYLGGEDKAAHSFQGKKTERNAAMFMPPGTCYVYHIYGTYCCVNISSEGEGAAVLVRAVEAKEGQDRMLANRSKARKPSSKPLKDKEVGNGPSKLTQALDISKNVHNQQDLLKCESLWLEDGIVLQETDIVHSTRVGVDYAQEWAKKKLRFYIRGNNNVSVRDKSAEAETGSAHAAPST